MIPPTGSKYTTSILLHPWPFGWGWFLFSDVMPMFCPYPTTCELDDYHKAGIHLCLRVKCPYHFTAKAMLDHKIKSLEAIRGKTEQQKATLARLQKKRREEFGKDI